MNCYSKWILFELFLTCRNLHIMYDDMQWIMEDPMASSMNNTNVFFFAVDPPGVYFACLILNVSPWFSFPPDIWPTADTKSGAFLIKGEWKQVCNVFFLTLYIKVKQDLFCHMSLWLFHSFPMTQCKVIDDPSRTPPDKTPELMKTDEEPVGVHSRAHRGRWTCAIRYNAICRRSVRPEPRWRPPNGQLPDGGGL